MTMADDGTGVEFSPRQEALIEWAAAAVGEDPETFIEHAVMSAVSEATIDLPGHWEASYSPPASNTRMRRVAALRQIIDDCGPIGMRELHEKYSELVDDPVNKRTLRVDLQWLREAGKIDARGEARRRRYAVDWEEYPFHRRELVERIVREHAPVQSGDVYSRYAATVSDPVSKRTIRDDLGKLQELGRVEARGEHRERHYVAATAGADQEGAPCQ